MRRVDIIQAISGPDATIEKTETFTTELNILIGPEDNRVMYGVAYVETMDLEIDSTTPAVQDQCGRTEVYPMGDNNWTLTISGIVSETEAGIPRSDNQTALNLTHERLKTLREGSIVTIDCPLHHGDFVVRNIAISMTTDVVSIATPMVTNNGVTMEDQLAFPFQLQLREV